MIQFRADVTIDNELQSKAARLCDTLPLMKSWGQGVARMAKQNARQHPGRFWREIADSVKLFAVDEYTQIVETDHVAAAQKQFGGDIRPKNKRALTIPVADEAKGKKASDFELGGRPLFVMRSARVKDQDTVGVLGYSAGGEFHPLFVLRTKVHQEPEPWWPTEAEVIGIANRKADYWLRKQLGSV